MSHPSLPHEPPSLETIRQRAGKLIRSLPDAACVAAMISAAIDGYVLQQLRGEPVTETEQWAFNLFRLQQADLRGDVFNSTPLHLLAEAESAKLSGRVN
jgi:hypothetical protein